MDRALAIVKAEGVDALSMRRLATEMGVTPRSLYHYVPDKPALLAAMVERVWAAAFAQMPLDTEDPLESLIQNMVVLREVWLSYGDLASLAVAVIEPGDFLYEETQGMALVLQTLGFPDVPLAYSAIQNTTMGFVSVAANRRASSSYFGRDPQDVLRQAKQLFARRGADDDHRGVMEARFDEGDDKHFEATLRALVAGLLAGR